MIVTRLYSSNINPCLIYLPDKCHDLQSDYPLGPTNTTIEYSEMSGQSTRFREVDRLRGAGVGFADLAILGEAEGQPVTMIIAPEACNDGMSGRDYALRVHFLRPGTSMPLLSGCCSMTAEQ